MHMPYRKINFLCLCLGRFRICPVRVSDWPRPSPWAFCYLILSRTCLLVRLTSPKKLQIIESVFTKQIVQIDIFQLLHWIFNPASEMGHLQSVYWRQRNKIETGLFNERANTGRQWCHNVPANCKVKCFLKVLKILIATTRMQLSVSCLSQKILDWQKFNR